MATLTGAARTAYVQAMFNTIAHAYDRMNTVMTFGRYRSWQRLAVDIAAPTRVGRVLDVATGTADIAVDLSQVASSVVAIDLSRPMLLAGHAKEGAVPIDRVEGDAVQLPFADNSFDCVTIGFGIRNIPDLDGALREMVRVVRPAGRVVCLELTRCYFPGTGWLFRWYFHAIVPLIGGWISGAPKAYRYLPDSVDHFPDADLLKRAFTRAGLIFADYRLLNLGTIAIHWGTKRIG